MKKAKSIYTLNTIVFCFLLCAGGLSSFAQTNDWGILVNNKNWYYERGEIFRGTKEQCERKCAELNYHPPTTNTFNVSNVGEYLIQQTPEELRGSALPSQSMMDDLGNALEEARRKAEKNVYTPAKITSDINGNVKSGDYAAVAAGQAARYNAEMNNEYVMTTIDNDARFNKDNKGFEGTPAPKKTPRSIDAVLQKNKDCNCSTLITDTEYNLWALEFVNSGRPGNEFKSFATEKYSKFKDNHKCTMNDSDFEIYYKKLVKLTNQEIDKRLIN